MSRTLKQSTQLFSLLQRRSTITHLLNNPKPNGKTVISRHQTQHTPTRHYFGSPRKVRDFDTVSSAGAVLSSSSSAASASTTLSRVGFVGWYLGMVKSRPIVTKSITCALIYTAADLSSQTIANSSLETYDFLRTSRMAGYGMLILGPSLHFWFNLMSKLFPGRDLASTFKKMAMGQGIYGPFMTVVFFAVNAWLQGENGTEVCARLRRDLVPTLISGIMYWPFCDFITFKFIPVHLQPLISNSFSYLWTIYLTYMASLEKVATDTC